MRNLLLLLFGIVVGAIAAANIINTLRQRDAYPRGLMDVMQHHYGALRDAAKGGRCGDGMTRDFAVLRQLSDEIATAVYASDTPDAPFREYDQRLHDALASTPANCAEASPALDRIGAACDACHRQYR